MKERTPTQIVRELTSSGLDATSAKLLSRASGLKGAGATAFIAEHDLKRFEISQEVQRALFGIVFAQQRAEVVRISDKPDCRAKFGRVAFDALLPAILDLFVDLKFRGDYTPGSRLLVQPLLVRNDLPELAMKLRRRESWSAVPPDRFKRRNDYLAAALGNRRAAFALRPQLHRRDAQGRFTAHEIG
jgi:hypothetical protein